MDFSSAHPVLQRALAARGYAAPTDVQEAMLAPGIGAADLLVSAQTGSGKTVAFGLAFAAELYGEGEALPAPGPPRALVVAPTRELAMQVRRELGWLYADARVISTVGGMSVRNEQRLLDQGVHIVVGTPGRLCDHLEQGHLDLGALRVVVLDEADEMLDMGFREELETILGAAPTERRTLFFSATLPPDMERLAARYAREPRRIAVNPPGEAHVDIEYRAVPALPVEREAVLVNVLRLYDARATLVFCATREGVEHLRARLVERGFAASAISGDLTQAERNRALEALRRGHARILVATDVAARGLDLPDLDLVVQADLPLDASVFQHRCGRTGRAGRKGTAVTLVPAARRRQAERIFREAGVSPIWSAPPSVELILERDRARLVAEVGTLCAEVGEDDTAAARTLLEAHPAEALVGALVRQLRQRLPEPEETPHTAALFERGRAALPARTDRPPARPDRASRGERARAVDGGDRGEGTSARGRNPADPEAGGVWFRVNVGREQNADPRWVLPMLCRRGRVDRDAIGAIRVMDRETRFTVDPAVAEQFFGFARRPDRREPWVKIIPAQAD